MDVEDVIARWPAGELPPPSINDEADILAIHIECRMSARTGVLMRTRFGSF